MPNSMPRAIVCGVGLGHVTFRYTSSNTPDSDTHNILVLHIYIIRTYYEKYYNISEKGNLFIIAVLCLSIIRYYCNASIGKLDENLTTCFTSIILQ